ncbi:MAG TPA: energy transducer TonB [Candidatus Gallibacteroides avistercoris]|uniref:Energy transducer TonB n=1 Tax=Candidatus Gallibacteroides avistercoris TaxID=2840833 RepID=A0A9D1SCF7_9BACT|nr:energy transducer TonB [Candidatus Gallibacteroides avistercoris]
MEIKKLPNVDLEKKKLTSFLIGYVVILTVLYVSFEWTTTQVTRYKDISSQNILIEEDILNTFITPPPPVKEKRLIPQEVFNPVVEEEDEETEQAETVSPPPPATEPTETVQPIITPPVPIEPEEEETPENYVFTFVDERPEFPGGGYAALYKWLHEHLEYPEIARENNIQGRVYCQFTVNRDGSISDIKVIKGVTPILDREAVRTLQKMPKWKPGKRNGKTVRTQFQVSVAFKLR